MTIYGLINNTVHKMIVLVNIIDIDTSTTTAIITIATAVTTTNATAITWIINTFIIIIVLFSDFFFAIKIFNKSYVIAILS